MLEVVCRAGFKRDLKLASKRGLETSFLQDAIMCLMQEKPLPERFHAHALSGNWQGFRECHIRPDWLLIYRIENGKLWLVRTGTHSDLFR